jgi:hypothetical protein
MRDRDLRRRRKCSGDLPCGHGDIWDGELTYNSVAELEALAGKLAIGLFPYREDAEYSASDAYPVTGNVLSVGGLYIVELPIDHLKENREGNNRYYLQMQDDRGHTIKDEMFEYVPYVP